MSQTFRLKQTWTGLKFGSRGEDPESAKGVKFLMPKTDPVGVEVDDVGVGVNEIRFKGRTTDWFDGRTKLGGDVFGDGIPGRTLGPEPFCLGMMLTTPERLPGGPTGRCWISPGLGGLIMGILGGETTGLSGLIRIRGGGRDWMCPSWTGLSLGTARSPLILRKGLEGSPGDVLATSRKSSKPGLKIRRISRKLSA